MLGGQVLKIETAMQQGILVVSMDGEFDMHMAKEFREVVDKLESISGARKILLDFKNVSFIDSSGVGAVLGRYKRSNAAGGEVMVVNLSPRVKKIFQLSGVLKIVKTLDSKEQAFL
jgi:stage II sporulation protein AA (anti-sigma F factor antagonist)